MVKEVQDCLGTDRQSLILFKPFALDNLPDSFTDCPNSNLNPVSIDLKHMLLHVLLDDFARIVTLYARS